MEDVKILTLRKPVTMGDETITSLTLREPTAGELERATAKGTGMTVAINLMSMVSGQPRQIIEKMGSRDFKEATAFIEGFTEDGPKDGATP